MNATDELRAMLDERGVAWRDEYNGFEYITAWHANGIYANFSEDNVEPNLLTVYREDLTPAQAIAATLGADEQVIERNVDGSYKCPKCGCVVDYDIRGDDERIITMDDYVIPFNFCPSCGAEVVDE